MRRAPAALIFGILFFSGFNLRAQDDPISSSRETSTTAGGQDGGNTAQRTSSNGPQTTNGTQSDQSADRNETSTHNSAPSNSGAATDDSQPTKKSLKEKLKDQFSSGCTTLGPCWGKDKSEDKNAASNTPPQNNAPPRSDDDDYSGVSSSKQTRVDLAPPAGEPGVAPGKEKPTAAGAIQEMRPWDPHKAEKNIEVGDFYMRAAERERQDSARLRSFRAAISRYQEALQWQDNNAMAKLRLGQALEAVGRYTEARKNYEGYLQLLPEGKYASLAEHAMDRLRDKPDKASLALSR